MDIEKIKRINQLIRMQATGTPTAFARRIGISERTLYRYFEYMKTEMKAPIKYNPQRKSYYYEQNGGLFFKWK